MIKLSPSQYSLAAPFLLSLDYHLAVRNLLAGKLPASVFVDDLSNPRLALAWARKRVFLSGEISNKSSTEQIRELLLDLIYPQAVAAGLPVLVLYYAPTFLGIVLEEIFSGKPVEKAAREHYSLQTMPANWQDWVPVGMCLQTIDANFLCRVDLDNMISLVDEIQSEGEPLERFVDDRLGICALSGNEIAGWCLSEYNLGERCDIGIETLEPYQRRGLGKAMTCALVELAHNKGITHIGWDCYRDNVPSVATARRAGFILDVGYEALVCWLTKKETHLGS